MLEAYEIRVCLDIGSHTHQVAIGLSTGTMLEEFSLTHTPSSIKQLFSKIEDYKARYQLPVVVAMEGYNGHARPIDEYVLANGYQLLNINNHKLAQFKKIFPGASKSDVIDTRKMFELFTLRDHLPLAKNVLQPVLNIPEVNEQLKRITRRRRLLVNEKVRIVNRLHSDLQAVSPGLSSITGSVDNKWFLHFLTFRNDLRQLPKLHMKSVLNIQGVGEAYAKKIKDWQKEPMFSEDVEWVGEMIIQDARRVLELLNEISRLEKKIEALSSSSEIACRLRSIGGFGLVSAAELAAEIGIISRFGSEASLALYVGMAVLDNSSGKYDGTKANRHVNYHAKAAFMVAIARHIETSSQSRKYYDKKRAEGKAHNQAIRALGRHMVRVIWSMLNKNRDYEIKE